MKKADAILIERGNYMLKADHSSSNLLYKDVDGGNFTQLA